MVHELLVRAEFGPIQSLSFNVWEEAKQRPCSPNRAQDLVRIACGLDVHSTHLGIYLPCRMEGSTGMVVNSCHQVEITL